MIKKIYKFLILLRGFDDYFYREVDVSSDCTLSELYYIILSSFDMISDKDFSNRKCKCCSTKCNFVNPKTKSFDNLPLKKTGIGLGSRFQMVCNCNGTYIFDLQVDDCKIMPLGKSKDYPKIIYGKGKGIFPYATPEEFQKYFDSLKEKDETEIKCSFPTGDLEIWDYTNYDLDADNSKLKRNIEYLKTISLHRDVSLFFNWK